MSKQPSTALVPLRRPTLKTGDDAQAAKELLTRFADAQNGLRRIVALGILAWEIKMVRLKHGDFGYWLAANAPDLCRAHSPNGIPQTSQALNTHMQLTKGVLESIGLPLDKYFKKLANVYSNPHQVGISNSIDLTGGNLILADEVNIPKQLLDLREKIFAVIDGKTMKQLLLDFKSCEEDAEGNRKAKVGRRKGEGGASHDQRVAARRAAEIADRAAREARMEELTPWMVECADDAHWGQDDDAIIISFTDAVAIANNYLANLAVRRAKKGVAQ